ncbi:MAG: FAD-dependent oxidoreductase [Nocardioidaceae bacterium]
MPPLAKPERPRSIQLPPRRGTHAAHADVLVVGGGPAGVGAAVGASRAGADAVLVERYGFLGGNATAALVMPLMSFYTHSHDERDSDMVAKLRLMPGDQGPGEPVVGGPLLDLARLLFPNGGALPPAEETGYAVPFDPEKLKDAGLTLLDDAGVRYLLHSFASGVIGAERPEGVVLETKSGPLVVTADVIVDCTGDGDVAALAGADFELGRPEDGLTQPLTLMFRMGEFDPGGFALYVLSHPGEWRGVHGLWDLVRKAEAAGELDLPREDILFFATPHASEVSVNSTRVPGLGTDVFDLTAAEYLARRQMRQIVEFLRRHVPGFERAYLIQSGATAGVRETRRIMGHYVLTGDDVLGVRAFDDGVARGSYPIDIHEPTGEGTYLRPLPPGGAYDVPLRCLIPRGVDGLLVGGRCISATREAQSSSRVTPIAMATGHAAGVCAALAAASGREPIDVPVRDVQRELVAQRARLRPELVREVAGAPAGR